MSAVLACEVPPSSLLGKYKSEIGFADCYVTEVPGTVTQEAFIEAFYTSPLFKFERTILSCVAALPATDADARLLASGRSKTFSAWRVEGQSASEILLSDFTGRTRSWLMAMPLTASTAEPGTLLYFGSAVVPRSSSGKSKPVMGWSFHALLGFHRFYSRLLLAAASRRARRA